MEITIRATDYDFVDVKIETTGAEIKETIYGTKSAHELFWNALSDTFKSQNDFAAYINYKLNE